MKQFNETVLNSKTVGIHLYLNTFYTLGLLIAQLVKNPPAMQETPV